MEGEYDPFPERFSRKVDALADWLEKDRLNLWMTFGYVLLIALARDMSEYFLLDEAFVTTSHPWIFSIAHHMAFFVLTYIGLVLILKVFSGTDLRKCMNYTNCYYWVLLLPPWIDRFICGQDTNYAYFSWTDFLSAFFTFGGDEFHLGQGIEVVVVLFALFAYVFWRRRDELEDIQGRGLLALRIGGMAFFTFISMLMLGTPGMYLPVGSDGGAPVFPNFDSTKYEQFHLFIFAFYYLACAALVLVLSYIALQKRFWHELGALRPYQTAFFAAIVLAGMAFAWQSVDANVVERILEEPFWVNFAYILPTVTSAVLAWQASVIWNDLSDRRWDSPEKRGRVLASGLLSPKVLREASIVLAATALAVSLLLSVQQFIIMVGILGLAFIYSFPPVRFKNALLSPLLMGAGTFLAFLYGAMTPYAEVGYVGSEMIPYLTGKTVVAILSLDSLMIGLFMFIGLVIGSIITDIDGYEEDSVGGVRTIYTAFGLERGTGVASVLVFLAALTPLIVFPETVDMVVFPVLGTVAALLLYRKRSSRMVMSVALLGLMYAALRFLSII
ncbi:MAG: UbiA family prenyltransferase [Methanomassiliicoccales archaeon]|nr:UbiA family prenyltransferase [Methanomassiliicoccales archaeon]